MEKYYKGNLVLINDYLGKKYIDSKSCLKVDKSMEIICTKKESDCWTVREVLTGIKIPEIDVSTLDVNGIATCKLYRPVTPLNIKSFTFNSNYNPLPRFIAEMDDLGYTELFDMEVLRKYCEDRQDLKTWLITLRAFLNYNNNNPFQKGVQSIYEQQNAAMNKLVKSFKTSQR